MDVADRIQRFVSEEILFEDPGRSVTATTPLLEGIVDSLGLMELVAFLEEEFGVQIEDEDITVDHFRTIADIDRLVRAKSGAEQHTG